jgi:3-isopropylmalate dehydrogenase
VQWLADKRQNTKLRQAGNAITAAVDLVLVNPEMRTPDLGGSMGCKAFAQAVANAVAIS